ncbi:hypothetical protein F5972_08405 [Microbispora cellulosiformans]|uniref:Uncharacterized protein n=1 Tax=Microbispora cellulosiformans TaxID=2614688 RepID=A0A5J5K7J7_9ACTN|nr:hypothetical protein [Microbispora cellulosiformans]KAA9379664.1 hypothetical protein F5972_08405 [Microbispora cellulosiformans]
MAGPATLLFAGLDISPAREFVATLVDPARHHRWVLPCVGRWSTATAIVAKHGHPERVEASDLCLFSSIVGYLADPRHTLEELEVRIPGDLARFTAGARDEHEHAAGVLLTVKFLSTPPKNTHAQELRTEMWRNAAAIRDKLADGLRQQVDLMRGCRYDVADVRDVINDALAAPDPQNTFFYANLPGYKGGYSKQYGAAETRIWACRLIAEEFDPADARMWLDSFTESPVFAAAYVHHGDDQAPPDWVKLGAFAAGPDRVDYIIGNRDPGDRLVVRKGLGGPPRQWPVYADQDITPESVISFEQVDKDTCLHYRDLFVHRLGLTKAERYCLMLIDGRVTTAFGLHTRDIRLGNSGWVGEVFGITVTSARYARLGKLFMLALTSGDFKRWVLANNPRLQQAEIVGISTASPTINHEGKTDRGVMKLAKREPRPGGGFQLLYQGEFRTDTLPEVMRRWHAEQAWVCRPGWDGPRLPQPTATGQRRKKRKGRGASTQQQPAVTEGEPA